MSGRPTRHRTARWACLVLGGLLAALTVFGFAESAGAQEEDGAEGQAPWEGYDPGPSPSDGDGELYHGRGETSSPWEEDDGCEHSYYAWGTPYWDCHSRGMSGDPDTHDGECEEEDFYFLTDDGQFVSIEGQTREHDAAFVVCQDDDGPYTADDFMQVEAPEEDEEPEPLDPEPDPFYDVDGARYRVCTNRAAMHAYGTDWMHCPTYGFRVVPCVETQGMGLQLGPIQIGDENEGFWEALADGFGDQFEARIVPDVEDPASDAGVDLEQAISRARDTYGDDLSWWYEEIASESDSEQGKGCSLAESVPAQRTCAEINEDRDHAQAVLDGYADDASGDASGDVTTGTLAQQDAEQAYYEEQLRDLESQGGIIPDTCFGTFPTDAYGIYYDSGSSFDMAEWVGQALATLGELAYGLLKGAISGALFLVHGALTLDVTEYRQTVADLSQRWDVELVNLGGHHTTLTDVAWFAVFATAALLTLRSRAGRGGGEIAGSMVMATLGGVLMAGAFTSGGYFDSAVGMVDTVSQGMLLAGSGCDANDDLDQGEVERLIAGRYDCGDDAADAANDGGLGGVIHREFVERPFRYVNWGTDDLSPACEEAEERLLRLGGTGSDYATRFMERQGCVDEANHSGQMTVGRLISILVVTVLGGFMALILASIAFTLLAAKFVVAVLFAFLPLFVVAAILPGNARRPALWWGENVVKSWLVALIVGAILASALVGFQAIAEATEGRSMVERQVIIAVLVVVLWSCYRQADRGGQIVASAGGRKLGEVLSPSGNWASIGGGGAGGGGGIPLNSPARMMSTSGIATTAALVTTAATTSTAVMVAARGIGRAAGAPGRGLGRSTFKRNDERRVANRSIRNLVRKDVLAGNLPVSTPTRTRGLKRSVNSLRRAHGRDHVPPKPGEPGLRPGRSLGVARASTTTTAARRAVRRDLSAHRPDLAPRPDRSSPRRTGPRVPDPADRGGTPAGAGTSRGAGSGFFRRGGAAPAPGGGGATARRTGVASWLRGRGDHFDLHGGASRGSREPRRHMPPTDADLSLGRDRPSGSPGGGAARGRPAERAGADGRGGGDGGARPTGGATGAGRGPGGPGRDTTGPAAAASRREPVSPASARQRAADAQSARQGELESYWDRVAGSYERYQRDLGRVKPKSKRAEQIRQQYAGEIGQSNYLYELNTGRKPPTLRLPWESGPGDA